MTAPRDWERELADMQARAEEAEVLARSRAKERDAAKHDLHVYLHDRMSVLLSERDAALSRVAELTAELRKSEQDAVTWAKAAHPNHIADVIARAEKAEERAAELEKKALEDEGYITSMQGHLADAQAQAKNWEAQRDDLLTRTAFCSGSCHRADSRALAERVAVLEEVAEAARKIPPYLNPRLNGALYRLDALRGAKP